MDQKEKVSIGVLVVVIIFTAIYFYQKSASQSPQNRGGSTEQPARKGLPPENQRVNTLEALEQGSDNKDKAVSREQRLKQLEGLSKSSEKSPPATKK